LLRTFAGKNNNEQQSQIHVKLKNLGNQLGKTTIWGNPMTEIFLLASGKLYQQQNTISSKGKLHLQNPMVPTNFALNFMPNLYCCMASLTVQNLENRAHCQLYGQNNTAPSAAKNTPTASNFVPEKCLKKHVIPPCCMDYMDAYSTASNNSK
jgi:hypothetical protein